MRVSFIVLFIFISNCTSLLQSSAQGHYSTGFGELTGLVIIQDERLDELVGRHAKINEERKGIPGFRIRIFSESGQNARQNALNVQAKFYNNYPDIETYLGYDPPNFKLYIGDFRTRSEALKIQRKISRDYPYSFIVSGLINFPSLD